MGTKIRLVTHPESEDPTSKILPTFLVSTTVVERPTREDRCNPSAPGYCQAVHHWCRSFGSQDHS